VKKPAISDEEKQFVARFNRFARRLKTFVEFYNSNRAIDLKKFGAVKAAWNEIEESDRWFREAGNR
jgi:hypothetical protein